MDDADLISHIPLFEGLRSSDRQELASHLQLRRYVAGESVFSHGDRGASLYLVKRGLVRIFLPGDPEVVVKEASAGEYFGELSLFDDKPRSASVSCLLDTELLELNRDVFEQYLGHSPRVAMSILAEMSERLRETNSMLSQRAAKDAVKELEANLSWGEKLADKVAALNGSWSFIFALCAITVLWALLNTVMSSPFDEYPYVFFNLVLAILVALQGPLIVMSQNREAKKDRAQAEADFRVNLKNEVNIEALRAEFTAFRAETSQRFDALERNARAARVSHEMPIKRPGGPLG